MSLSGQFPVRSCVKSTEKRKKTLSISATNLASDMHHMHSGSVSAKSIFMPIAEFSFFLSF